MHTDMLFTHTTYSQLYLPTPESQERPTGARVWARQASMLGDRVPGPGGCTGALEGEQPGFWQVWRGREPQGEAGYTGGAASHHPGWGKAQDLEGGFADGKVVEGEVWGMERRLARAEKLPYTRYIPGASQILLIFTSIPGGADDDLISQIRPRTTKWLA